MKTKIKLCNAFSKLNHHSETCPDCRNYLIIGFDDLCNKGKEILANELMFVDLWNLREWYAKEFVKALRQKMGLEQ